MNDNITEHEALLEEFIEKTVPTIESNSDVQIDEERELHPESEKIKEPCEDKSYPKCELPEIKINCDLQVEFDTKNRAIYVCPGKLQYFTARAICCSGDETIEIEYLGHNTKCINGKEKVIYGNLGFYKIIKSGIIFIPKKNLSESIDDFFPTDILRFKAKDNCEKDVEFDVVFTYSRCVNCGYGCKCHKV